MRARMSTIPKKNISQLFVAKIRELRICHQLTQTECADLAGMGRRSYRRLEEGQTRRIKLSTVERVASVFGLKMWELLKAAAKRP